MKQLLPPGQVHGRRPGLRAMARVRCSARSASPLPIKTAPKSLHTRWKEEDSLSSGGSVYEVGSDGGSSQTREPTQARLENPPVTTQKHAPPGDVDEGESEEVSVSFLTEPTSIESESGQSPREAAVPWDRGRFLCRVPSPSTQHGTRTLGALIKILVT